MPARWSVHEIGHANRSARAPPDRDRMKIRATPEGLWPVVQKSGRRSCPLIATDKQVLPDFADNPKRIKLLFNSIWYCMAQYPKRGRRLGEI
jgi:hypothetical protein